GCGASTDRRPSNPTRLAAQHPQPRAGVGCESLCLKSRVPGREAAGGRLRSGKLAGSRRRRPPSFKEFLGTYNKLTETCFLDCVKDFTTREVKPEETTCSEHCLQKYLKMTQRISMRFQEYHIQQNEALAAKAGLLGQPR
ncbi:hypothetical protein MC885_001597, partial [Smutsia gigantea]